MIIKKSTKQLEAGFSLIEVVIAMAIFSFIIGGIVMFSVNSIKANTKSRAMQEAMDNARYAIDDLAKKVRTSSNVALTNSLTGEAQQLFFVDNLTLAKYCYRFNTNGSMEVATYSPDYDFNIGEMLNEDEYKNAQDCRLLAGAVISDSDNGTSFTKIVGDGIDTSKIKISGKFEVLETEIHNSDPHRGFVRMIIGIKYKGTTPEDSAETFVQSGVSIADYTREDSKL